MRNINTGRYTIQSDERRNK